MHVCACGDKSMDGLWLNWDSELFFPHMAAKTNFGDGGWPFKILLYHFCRMSSAVWPVLSSLSAPVLHLTNGNLLAFAPEACQPSSREGADGWQTTRRSGNAASLLFLFFSVPAYCRLFSWFLPGDRSAMPSKCFFLSVPVHSYRSNLTQGYLIWGFFFFSFLATPPPHAPRHRPIILLLKSLPPPPSQLANIPPPSIPAQFADSFLFLRGGLCSCWCLWFRPMAQLPRS